MAKVLTALFNAGHLLRAVLVYTAFWFFQGDGYKARGKIMRKGPAFHYSREALLRLSQ